MVLDLPAGVKLINAYRINNAGQILAEGRGPDGFSYYRLDPVPEPVSASLVAMVVACWCQTNRRRAG